MIRLWDIMVTYEKSPQLAKTTAKLREYALTKEQAHAYFTNLAKQLGIDLRKTNLEETRKILSKGTPLSYIVKENRDR